tara:strand:+ start:3736 stop:3930 length:195 start_codon:yes stop_codon:yes gene_type:complete
MIKLIKRLRTPTIAQGISLTVVVAVLAVVAASGKLPPLAIAVAIGIFGMWVISNVVEYVVGHTD